MRAHIIKLATSYLCHNCGYIEEGPYSAKEDPYTPECTLCHLQMISVQAIYEEHVILARAILAKGRGKKQTPQEDEALEALPKEPRINHFAAYMTALERRITSA